MDKFLQLFEGMELTPEFQAKLKSLFDETVAAKINETVKTVNKEDEDLGEATEVPSIDNGPEKPESELDNADLPNELAKDIDVRRILSALQVNPSLFARSLRAANTDIKGNNLGDDAFESMLKILEAIADNPSIANMLANKLREIEAEKDKPAEPEAAKAEEVEVETNEELSENIDRYLSYVADEWMKENSIAVEQGIKTELLESFISGLKNLFEEHNIEVPEKESIVVKLETKIKSLEEQVNAGMETEITLKRELSDTAAKVATEKAEAEANLLKEQVNTHFASETQNLPSTVIEKLSKLNETIEYSTLDEYKGKLALMKKTSIDEKRAGRKILNEEDLNVLVETEQPKPEIDPTISKYVNAIKRNSKF